MAGKNQRLVLIGALALAGLLAFVYRGIWFKEQPAYLKHVGSPLPDARLTRLDGTTTQLSELLGPAKTGEKTILSFWATWCDPCVRELPIIERKRHDYEKLGIRVVLVNYDGPLPDKSLPEVKAWLVTQKLSLETFFEFGEELLKTMGVEALPFAVGADDQRRIKWLTLGEIDWADEKKIQAFFN